MNLYKVRFGEKEGVFEYHFLIRTNSLKDINSIRKEHGFGVLNSNDIELLRNCGGTLLYKEDGCWILNYLVDLDFDRYENIDYNQWMSKIKIIVDIIRRDMKISKVLI